MECIPAVAINPDPPLPQLYHACDQETYNWCLMKLSALQFCDFYSAILAFWVTLIAMAEVPHTLYSLLHMAGAVVRSGGGGGWGLGERRTRCTICSKSF